MKCPHDQTTLVMSERAGIEIDYCPTCRGVWLDRGELDKIIERSAQESGPSPSPGKHHDKVKDQRGRRKSSWLGELFD